MTSLEVLALSMGLYFIIVCMYLAVIDVKLDKLQKQQPQNVRCKDCENAVVYDGNEVICTHIDSNGNDTHSADWFCADGKRKKYKEYDPEWLI